MAIMTVALAILCVVLAICAIKWHLTFLSTSYIMAQHGIEPTEDEAKEAAIYVIKHLFSE